MWEKPILLPPSQAEYAEIVEAALYSVFCA